MSWEDTQNPFAKTSKTPRSPTKAYTPLYNEDGEKLTKEQDKEESSENSNQGKQKSDKNSSQEKTDSNKETGSNKTHIDENVTQRKHKNKTEEDNTKTDKILKKRISCQFLHENKILNDIDFSFELPNKFENKLENEQDLKTFFEAKIEKVQKVFEEDHTKYRNFNDTFDTWSIDTNMVIPIKDITDLIKEYKGEEKDLNSFIKNIDKLWGHIADYEQTDKDRFMLVIQLKLTDKAADATKKEDFKEWTAVRKALKENINPQNNIEKAELKLSNIKQKEKEDIEKYAKRVEEALDNFNKSFNLDDENEVLKKENDRKARRAFENGLFDPVLRNKVITRGNKTMKESVDYVIEQELRQTEIPVNTPTRTPTSIPTNTPMNKFCNYCKMTNHTINDCRRRQYNNNFTNTNPNTTTNPNNPNTTSFKREITCYKCSKIGHYASECRSPINTNEPSQNNRNNISDNANNIPRSPYFNSRTPPTSNSNSNNPNSSNGNNHNNSNNNNSNSNNLRLNRDRNYEARNPRNVRFYETDLPIEEATVYADEETKN